MRGHGMASLALGLAMALSGFALAGDAAMGERAALAPAEKAGWKLHFRDDFKRSELGGAWRALDGTWSVEDGGLKGRGTLLSTRGFPDDSWGFTRLEFEFDTVAADSAGEPGWGVLIHARPPEKAQGPAWRGGYLFQWGSEGSRLLRDGEQVASGPAPKQLPAPGQWRRVVVENDQGELRFYVDERLVLAHKDKSAFAAGKDHCRVGFFFSLSAKARNVRVYVKRLDDMDAFL